MRIEVLYDDERGKWKVVPKRMSGHESYHSTKHAAEKMAKTLARENDCTCEIYVKNGRFQREYDYHGKSQGFDPDQIDIPGL